MMPFPYPLLVGVAKPKQPSPGALGFAAYDGLNRLTNMVDAAGTSRFTRNSMSRLLTEDGPWASDIVSYTYTNGLRSRMTVERSSAALWTQNLRV